MTLTCVACGLGFSPNEPIYQPKPGGRNFHKHCQPMEPEPTTYRNYIRQATRTEPDYTAVIGRVVNPKTLRLLHAVMGIGTEAGEIQDAVKKHLFYGKPLDVVNMKEEGGDLFWYLAILADTLGESNFTNMLQTNIAKLRARYPDKFTEEKAQYRDLAAERAILDGNKDVEVLNYTPRHD